MAFSSTKRWMLIFTAIFMTNQLPSGSASVSTPNFIQSGKGQVDRSNLTKTVKSTAECALLCKVQRICSMFSVTGGKDSGRFLQNDLLCRVAYGYSSWTPDDVSDLYIGETHFCVSGLFMFTYTSTLYYGWPELRFFESKLCH